MAVAVVLLLLSTAAGFYKLNKAFNLITGAPSFSTGETNITVSAVTSLSLSGGNGTMLSFGSGYVNGTCNWCQMDTNGINASGFANGSNHSSGNPAIAPCCVSFTVPSAGFLLENTGNQNLSVGYTCTGNCTFASYLGGVRTGYIKGTGLEIKVTPNSVASQSGEEGATDTAQSCQGGGTLIRDSNWNITNSSAYSPCYGIIANDLGLNNGNCTGIPAQTYTSLTSIGHWLCGNSSNYPLAPDNSRDAAVIDINLTVLSDAPATGVRSSFRLTFNGTSAG